MNASYMLPNQRIFVSWAIGVAFIVLDTLLALALHSVATTHFEVWLIGRGVLWPLGFMYYYRKFGRDLSEFSTWLGMLCGVIGGVLINMQGTAIANVSAYVVEALWMIVFTGPIGVWAFASLFLVLNALNKRYLQDLRG